MDYRENKDLQQKWPIYSFTSWHPDIYKAFTETYSSCIGSDRGFFLKSADEPRSRFYQDVTTLMAWDQMDVALGEREEHKVSSDADKGETKKDLISTSRKIAEVLSQKRKSLSDEIGV